MYSLGVGGLRGTLWGPLSFQPGRVREGCFCGAQVKLRPLIYRELIAPRRHVPSKQGNCWALALQNSSGFISRNGNPWIWAVKPEPNGKPTGQVANEIPFYGTVNFVYSQKLLDCSPSSSGLCITTLCKINFHDIYERLYNEIPYRHRFTDTFLYGCSS